LFSSNRKSPRSVKDPHPPTYGWRAGRLLLWLCLAACAGAALARLVAPVPTGLLLGLLFGLLGVIAAGVFWPRSGVFARPLISGPAGPHVALTFDDGPDPVTTPQVLDLLAQHGAQATFFVIGARAARHPQLLAEMVRRGHQVENHSLNHAYTPPFLSVRRLTDELLAAQAIIAAATARPPTWFRPPVGLLSPRVALAARRAGLRLCGYSRSARDGLAGTGVEAALARLRGGLRPGAILVLHDAAERAGRTPIAPQVLARLLPLMKERGLRPVTLDDLMANSQKEPSPP
jgi:peptidoglycan/xylan/chitin deacetylase (PgdA/CDA1 family)